MGLKEMIQKDVKKIFLNPLEFGERHVVDGAEMQIIIDENELVEREKRVKSMAQGLYTKQLLVYVSEEDFGSPPLIGRRMELDEEYYTVIDVINEAGIYSISLEANES